MREIYELKEKILGELKKYAEKPEISASGLETIDKLAHAAKNLGKIVEDAEEESEYSGHWGPMYYAGARGGRGRGGNARRDSMGRYSSEGNRSGGNYSNEGGNYSNEGGSYSGRYSSRGYARSNGEMVEELRGLMEETQDPRVREDISRLVSKMERQ